MAARRPARRAPMTRLASLSGQGRLLVGRDDLGEVEYRIDIFVDPTSKDGRGWMTGDFRALERAFTSQDVALRLKSGKEVKIVVKEANGEHAVILTSGPIPDY